ncbi:MAG: tetratricopeptide repeat protein [Magnetovibrionaceae bacterium]
MNSETPPQLRPQPDEEEPAVPPGAVMPNASLFFHADAVETKRDRLMGRHVVGAGFLQGFVRHSGVGSFLVHALNRGQYDDLAGRIGAMDKKNRPIHQVDPARLDTLASAGTLQFPGAAIADLAWRRRRQAQLAGPKRAFGGQRAYSICGMAFGLAQESAQDSLASLITAPLQPWDALVCPSLVAKNTIKRLFDSLGEYYDQRFGGYAQCEAQLPVIPFGVDCDALEPRRQQGDSQQDGERALIRHRHDIADDDLCLLYVGRLSFHAKSHPIALFQAAAEARRRTGRRLHILMCGWFANDGIAEQFRTASRLYCPDVPVHFLDGRDPATRRAVWRAGDIFVSLNDSLQSAQGTAVIEAMAAGLPVIASDWGAIGEALRHGIDGFLIPTWLPAGGYGGAIGLDEALGHGQHDRLQAYNLHAGQVSQTTVVDAAAAAEALTLLAGDRDLRRRLGESARARARARYDWRVVIAAYQVLWRELGAIRGEAEETAPLVAGAPANPVRDDPYALFSDFPAETLDLDSRVQLAEGVTPETIEQAGSLMLNDIAGTSLLGLEERLQIFESLRLSGACDVNRLVADLKDRSEDSVIRTLAWMAKMGLVRLANGPAGDDLFGLPAGFAAKGADRPAWRATSGADSVEYWHERLAEDEWDVEALSAIARQARKEGDAARAVEAYEKALEREPDDPEINNAVGEIRASAGDLKAAMQSFRRALRGAPGFGAAHRNLGRALFLAGDPANAINTFERALTLSPEDAEAWYLLGVAHRRGRDPERARTCLARALDLDPDHVDALCHLGLAEKALGRRAQALEAFYKADFHDPGNVFALSAEASLAVEPAGRARVEKGGGESKRVALHLAQRSQYSLFRPLFDAFAERHWPLLTVDDTDLADFQPHAVVICDAQAKRLKALVPEAWMVFVWPSFTSSDALLAAARSADLACTASEPDRMALVRSGMLETRIWITGDVTRARAMERIVGRVSALKPKV